MIPAAQHRQGMAQTFSGLRWDARLDLKPQTRRVWASHASMQKVKDAS